MEILSSFIEKNHNYFNKANAGLHGSLLQTG